MPRRPVPSRRLLPLVAAAALLSAAVGPASAAPPAPLFPKLDPNVVRAIKTGVVSAWQRGKPVPGPAPVLIELTAPATPATLAALRAAGADLPIVDGGPVFYDRFVPAHLDAAAAAAIAVRADVTRVSLLSGRGPLPLDHSAELVRLADARGARPALDLVTGAGMVIGDVDTIADIYHPTFFRGDAGYFDWIDVDGDGVLTPGVDAIDLNGNGVVDPGETAEVVTAETDAYGQGPVPARPAGFDPSIDWLYLDTNGNGARDYGAAAGFNDKTPAFGEPLFVPDDVNRNGKLDVGERVVRLGTSKFRSVDIDLDYMSLMLSAHHVYKRGKDMATLPVDFSHGALYGFPDALHATGVLTIVAGDVPLVGRRWVGFAPDAELVLGFEVTQTESLPATTTAWVLAQKPDVMLYEMAPWTGSPLDGSDPLSAIIDASNQKDGTIHTCPTGDQGSAHKHTRATVAAGTMTSLALDVPSAPKAGMGPLDYVEISLHVQGGTPSAITVESPLGDTVDALSGAQGTLASTGAQTYATAQTTARGVFFVDLILYAAMTSTPIPVGGWTVNITGAAGAVTTVDAYVSDDKSSWGLGAGWDKSIATDDHTIGIPSTADHCIAVGAHPNHVEDPNAPWYAMYYGDYDVPPGFVETQGQVRAYSPRGPRIDGVQKPDVLAPDNPWVAQDTGTDPGSGPYGSFQLFGGTSGASPHVTGTAALLAQAGIKGDAARDAIRMGAVSDVTTGTTPNPDYGYGRLDAAGAFGVKAKGADPTLSLTVKPAKPTTADTVIITPVATSGDASTGVQIKWDDNYDGTWDVPYAPVAPRQVTSAVPATRLFKARVRNAAGHVAEAVLSVTFAKPPPPVTKPTPTPTTPSTKGGCACRAAPSPAGGTLPALGAAIAALAARRRRRR